MKPRNEMTLAEAVRASRKPVVNVEPVDDADLFARRVRIENTPRIQALRASWERTYAAYDIAMQSYRKHGNRARFRAEMAAITEAAE